MERKLFTAIFFIALLYSYAFTQSTTLDISGGYNLALAPNSQSVERNGTRDTSFPYYYTTSAKTKSMSYGQGGSIAFNFNWYSKKDIGFGFKLNMLIGSPFSHSAVVTDIYGDKEYYRFTDKAFSFQFIPHLCFKHDYKIVSPVLEAGMVIGMTQIDQKYQATHSRYTSTIQSNIRDYGNVLLGFYSSVGLSFNVSKVVKINLALNCVAGSYSPSKWKRTMFTVDGVNRMSALSTSEVQGEYVKELDFTATQSNSRPAKDLKYSAAFSNVGITAGICFRFAKTQKKVTKKGEQNIVHPF